MNRLITAATSRKSEDFARGKGISGAQMMESAGRAVAETVRRNFPASEILVLCGPGNNGGDGYVAARLLRQWGWRTRLVAAAPVESRFCRAPGSRIALKGLAAGQSTDAAAMAQRWHGPILPLDALTRTSMRPPQLVVDALFGAGLRRDISGEYARAIETLISWNIPSLAVDVPSGVDGDSGAIRGTALPARMTVCFFRARPGHYLLPGRALRGKLLLHDIGIPAAALAVADESDNTALNRPCLWRAHMPHPRLESHKYHRGHVLVCGGGLPAFSNSPGSRTALKGLAAGHAGAARLAARAALRCAAGLVTLAGPPEALAAHAAQETSVMLAALENAGELPSLLAERRISALVLGPGNGVGEATRRLVLEALRLPVPLVLDADALTSFAGREAEFFAAIAERPPRPPNAGNAGKDAGGDKGVVLTPHGGEFARLFADCSGEDKLTAARQAAKRSGAIVLFKGADSVVAAPRGRALIADNAPPTLATAGSGDVLAGMIGGLLGAGMPSFEAAACAVWMHGEAARRFGTGLTAEDLPRQLPEVWRNLEENNAGVVER